MGKICVYTCITGNYDNLNEIKHPEKGIDYYCFTNNQNLKSKTWKIIQIKDSHLDNCRLARKIKTLGHPTINQYDIAVWIDADVVWQKSISEFIDTYIKNKSFAIFKHHIRNNVYDEAVACLQLRKDDKDTIQNTLNYLKNNNYPDNNGLCESTVFIKKPKDPTVIKTMQVWFDVIKNYCRRDQLSFNYAIWKTNLQISIINLNVWDNPWFYTAKHLSTPKIKDCQIYYGNPNQNFDFKKNYTYKYQVKNNLYTINTIIPFNTNQIEVNFCDIIGASYNNLTITPNPKRIQQYGFTIINQSYIFCTNHSTIKIFNDFKENQKLSISFNLLFPNQIIINETIENQWIENNSLLQANNQLKSEVQQLKTTNSSLQNEIQKIKSSKSWRIIEKTKKLVPHK